MDCASVNCFYSLALLFSIFFKIQQLIPKGSTHLLNMFPCFCFPDAFAIPLYSGTISNRIEQANGLAAIVHCPCILDSGVDIAKKKRKICELDWAPPDMRIVFWSAIKILLLSTPHPYKRMHTRGRRREEGDL